MLILGICSGHDAGAALIKDGKILAAVNEERFNRIKNYNGEPYESIKTLLKSTKTNPKDVSYVTFSKVSCGRGEMNLSSPFMRQRLMSKLSNIGIARFLIGTNLGVEFLRIVLNKKFHPIKVKMQYAYLKKMDINAPFIYIDHHLAHIASAYYTSGWDECLAVSLDAMGDGYCCRVAICKNGSMRIIKTIPAYHSPAYYYSYTTKLLGFKEGRDEGKVTGLAAYGNAFNTLSIFKERIDYSQSKKTFINRGKYLFPEIKILARKLESKKPEDIAAGVQYHLEKMTVSLIEDILKETGLNKIVLAGGIFANVKLNQRIKEIGGVEDIWVHPNMGDGGGAMGSALFFWAKKMLKNKKKLFLNNLENVFLGPDFSESEIEYELKKNNLKYKKVENIEEVTADYLAKGKIVARFAGRMEYGPRALGNRSILCQAKEKKTKDLLNDKLCRTKFMPFAPAILEESAKEYIYNYSNSFSSEFMTMTYDVTEKCEKEAPLIVHTDNTIRPQIINKGRNPALYKILKIYNKKTGLPLVLNTSFNVHEEPIVCSPKDAISTFKRAQLDILAIGNFIAKNGNLKKAP